MIVLDKKLREFVYKESNIYEKIFNELIKNQKDIDSNIVDLVDKNFWDLLEK